MKTEEAEIESKREWHVAVRCAKAAILLASLKSSPNRYLNTSPLDDQDEEKMTMAREIRVLRMELARERKRSRGVRLCGLMELVLQLGAVLAFSTLLLVIAFGAP